MNVLALEVLMKRDESNFILKHTLLLGPSSELGLDEGSNPRCAAIRGGYMVKKNEQWRDIV